MIDIALNNLNKYYGANHILKDISFEVYAGTKAGLLGRNGSGKTTLFRIITGEEAYESGGLAKAKGRRVEMLRQIPLFEKDATAEDVLRSSFAEVDDVYKAMKKIEGNADLAALLKYGRLMEYYERLGGYDMEVKLDKICSGMNIEHLRGSLFEQLSGGEKTRVNLARILLRDCDILLLDEPTNHLDLSSIEWLEEFLLNFSGTVVVISHDRAFLDRVATRIIEIEDGKANLYSGNYSFYIEEKESRFLSQAELYKQQQRKIIQLEAAIKRQRVWAQMNPSNASLARRAKAMERRIEKMVKVEKPKNEKVMAAGFESASHAAKEIVSLNAVCKSYGENIILRNVNVKILRNERIAVVGANGCGKSTLLKLLTGEENADCGEIKISSNINRGYMPQLITFPDMNGTVLDLLRAETGAAEEKARAVLAKFKFFSPDVLKKASSLSGGEKSRLKLCLLMQKNINFLLLDEPTNHLDIQSREWIERALEDFDGTLLFVSHDRYFLDKFADKVWHIEDGNIFEG